MFPRMKSLSTLSMPLLFGTFAACANAPPPTANAAEGSERSAACPGAVRRSIVKDFGSATIAGCKPTTADGHEQFEVMLNQGAQRVEVDVAPDGTILQIETVVPVTAVPAKVMAAFSAKYPGANATRAEKQVRTSKGTFYELEFDAQPKGKEVTFAEDGTFIEEE